MTTTRRATGRAVGRAVAGVVGAVVLAWVVLSFVGLDRVLSRLATADPLPVAVGLAGGVLALLVWSEALAGLLRTGAATTPGWAGRPVTGLRYRLAYLSGDFAKQILPMGHASGPAVMAVAIRRQLRTGYDRTLAVVTAAELLGLVASLLLAAVGLAALALTGPVAYLGALAGVVLLALLVVGLVVALLWENGGRLGRVAEFVATLLRVTVGRVVGRLGAALAPGAATVAVERYRDSLTAATADRRAVARAGGLAVLGWACYVAPLYTAALALGAPVSPWVAAFAVPVAGLATWLPVPGGTGGVEAVLAALLVTLSGLTPAGAVAVALLYRLSVYWFVLVPTGLATGLLVSGVLDDD